VQSSLSQRPGFADIPVMLGHPLRGSFTSAISRALSLCLVGAILALAPVASALPIIDWDIQGSDGQTASVLSAVADVSGTDLTPVNVTPWPGGYCCFTAASDWEPGSAAPDLSKYYEFSVTAAAGHSIVYEDLTLSLFRGIQGTDHGAQLWELRSSHDGYASSLAFFDISSSPADEQTLFSAVDISAVGMQPGTVTFRLYGYDYTSSLDFSGLGNQPGSTPLSGTGSNLVVGGVVVPEPETLAQLGLGLAVLALAGGRRFAL
jgi:hypothetical protein